MIFKDNPLKFMKKVIRGHKYNVWYWMYAYRHKTESFPRRVKQLQWSLDGFYQYGATKEQYETLRQLYKKYKTTQIGWD